VGISGTIMCGPAREHGSHRRSTLALQRKNVMRFGAPTMGQP
jgi:hypothetical protein